MNRKKLIWQIPFLLFLLIGSYVIIAKNTNSVYQKDEGLVFGTIYHITYESNANYKSEIEAELKKVDQSLSPFNPTSIISRINRNEQVEADSMFCDVFTLAEKISQETDGAFDITVAPLVNLWGFGFKKGIAPNQNSIDSIHSFIGYKKVSLRNKHVIKENEKTMLDCSAIAKGYGSDVVAKLLKAKGVKNFMVEIGGEVVVNGVNDKNKPWHIGINKPTDDSLSTCNELQDILEVTDMAMATSGNYRNFYYKNGKKYAHTIDPKTGQPVQHSILSATVLAKDCATADAYATSFMVMGIDKAKEILKKHPELCAYLIYADEKGNNKVWYSPNMKAKLLTP